MAPRILVDLLGFTGARGGTETYAREIVTRMPAWLPEARFVALVNRVAVERVGSFFPGDVRVARWVGADRVTWAAGELLAVNRASRALGIDVIWSPANFGPIRRARAGRVITAHDVIYHEARGAGIAGLMAWPSSVLMARSTVTADAVITGSYAAAAAVEARIGVPASEMTVIPHGTRDGIVPDDPWGQLAPLGITPGRPLVLSTGNRLPHKNFDGLVRALATVPPEHRPLLVVTGGRGDDPLASLVADLGLTDDVCLPGWVSTQQLESLYAVAALYACPSLSEGFGLPVVDAMRRGCVVLANDVPVLREVGSTAARYADATSPVAFGRAMTEALGDSPEPERRARGREWSEQFTWEESARRTADVLTEVAASSGSRRA